MDRPEYDYHGLLAETWDLWRDNTSNWDDRFFYLDIVFQFGEPVLDVGCGTGRIGLDYRSQGVDIEGVDNSPEMLDICRQKAEKMGLVFTLYQQQMETLDLPRHYRTILVPSSTFQLVYDPAAAARVMQRFWSHLEPGGALVMPFSFDWIEGEPTERGWSLLFEKVRPTDGAVVRSWTREWYETHNQYWHSENRIEVEVNGQIVASEIHRHSPEGRWYSQTQAGELFQTAGFKNIRLFHEFTHERAKTNDRLFCASGIK